MDNVLIVSKNPVKKQAVQEVFTQFFSQIRIDTLALENSGLKNQPIGEEETYQSSRQRVRLARKQKPSYDYFVGIEGGIGQHFSHWFAFGGICIMDNAGHTGYGTSPNFQLPESTIKRLLQKEELGLIVDEWTQDTNSKQKGGAIGFLTNGRMGRQQLYVHGLTAALVPFLNSDMYFKSCSISK